MATEEGQGEAYEEEFEDDEEQHEEEVAEPAAEPQDQPEDEEKEDQGEDKVQAEDEEPLPLPRPHTSGGLEELKKAKKVVGKEWSEWQKTRDEEADLKLRVNKLRDQLLKSTVRTSVHRSAMYHLHMADSEKAQMKSRKGLDHLERSAAALHKRTPANDAELQKLATTLRKYHERHGGTENQTWYGLFKKIDDNNDNHISLVEFKKMVRDHMHVPVNVVSDKKIDSAWRSLDLDEDGLIDAGCFGRFYRRVEIANEREYLTNRRKQGDEHGKRGLVWVPQIAVGMVGNVAKDMHWKSRSQLEKKALTPMQESRIEVRRKDRTRELGFVHRRWRLHCAERSPPCLHCDRPVRSSTDMLGRRRDSRASSRRW